MSRSARPGRWLPALTDPDTAKLLHACGKHVDLVFEHVLQTMSWDHNRLISSQVIEQHRNSEYLELYPLYHALQSRYADCRCSAFGRLKMRAIESGSVAEGLDHSGRPPKYQASNKNVMVELGPVHWTFSSATEVTAVEGDAGIRTADTNADSGGAGESGHTPRLVIAETENPGFVLVLQERRDDYPHQEPRPFRAEAVTQFALDWQTLQGKGTTQRSKNERACYFERETSEAIPTSDTDEILCLHVPLWWFSNEFFTRHRANNWPPEAVRDNIRQFGLHLVPVGAPGSATENLVWGLSFCRAELVISYCLTSMQRQVLIAFSIYQMLLREAGKAIKPYFVKTAMLWLCEQTPTEDWTDITQGTLKVLDYLDEAVRTGILPCYFYSRNNLLHFASRADREDMERTLRTIRRHMQTLMAHAVCVLQPKLRQMLTQKNRHLSERQLRVCLTRFLITWGILMGMRDHFSIAITDHLSNLLPVLLRSYTPSELASLFREWSSWYRRQITLYQALTVAPEDVASQVHLSASGDGFVFDAAPLLALLTEDDLGLLFLGNTDVVRAWLRRQHQLPETEQQAGLPPDLRSPRNLCDLLLNSLLHSWTLMKSLSSEWAEIRSQVAALSMIPEPVITSLERFRSETLQRSTIWRELGIVLHTELGMDPYAALRMACRIGVEMRQLLDDPETLAKFRRICYSLQDPWELRKFAFRGSEV